MITAVVVSAGGAVVYLQCFKPHHPDSWHGLDLRQALAPAALLRYAKLALPGIASMGEWWFWESIAFMAGELGRLQLATHTIGYAMIHPPRKPCMTDIYLYIDARTGSADVLMYTHHRLRHDPARIHGAAGCLDRRLRTYWAVALTAAGGSRPSPHPLGSDSLCGALRHLF